MAARRKGGHSPGEPLHLEAKVEIPCLRQEGKEPLSPPSSKSPLVSRRVPFPTNLWVCSLANLMTCFRFLVFFLSAISFFLTPRRCSPVTSANLYIACISERCCSGSIISFPNSPGVQGQQQEFPINKICMILINTNIVSYKMVQINPLDHNVHLAKVFGRLNPEKLFKSSLSLPIPSYLRKQKIYQHKQSKNLFLIGLQRVR